MMRLRTVIQDPDAATKQLLLSVLGRASYVEDAIGYERFDDAIAAVCKLRPDIAFLRASDQVDKGMAKLRQATQVAAVVLVADDASLAFSAFESGVLDYIVKPYTTDRILAAVEKVVNIRSRYQTTGYDPCSGRDNQQQKIFCTRERNRSLVDVRSIVYATARGNYVELSTANGLHRVRMKFGSFLERLNPREFVPANRSAVVKLSEVCEIRKFGPGQYTLILSEGSRVRIGRRQRALLLDTLQSLDNDANCPPHPRR